MLFGHDVTIEGPINPLSCLADFHLRKSLCKLIIWPQLINFTRKQSPDLFFLSIADLET